MSNKYAFCNECGSHTEEAIEHRYVDEGTAGDLYLLCPSCKIEVVNEESNRD